MIQSAVKIFAFFLCNKYNSKRKIFSFGTIIINKNSKKVKKS